MKWFKDLKTATKLISTFIIMSVVLGAVGIYSLINLSSMDEKIGFMYNERVIPISDLGRAETDFQRLRVLIRDMMFTSTTQERKDEINEQGVQAIEEIESKLEKYSNTIITPGRAGNS